MISIVIIIVVVAAIALFIVYAAQVEKSNSEKEERGPIINYYSEEMATKARNMEKLEAFIDSNREKFTNQMVQDALGVTATSTKKYLDEFEKQGLIHKVGENGELVYYKKRVSQ